MIAVLDIMIGIAFGLPIAALITGAVGGAIDYLVDRINKDEQA